jgi:hypothetical protein
MLLMSLGTTRCKCSPHLHTGSVPRRSGANRHDSLSVEPILDGMPVIKRGGRGRQRRRPVKPHPDKGYDIPQARRYLRHHGITPIAGMGVDSSARLGRHRWVVERTLGWLLSYNARPTLRPHHRHHHRAGPPRCHPHLRSTATRRTNEVFSPGSAAHRRAPAASPQVNACASEGADVIER